MAYTKTHNLSFLGHKSLKVFFSLFFSIFRFYPFFFFQILTRLISIWCFVVSVHLLEALRPSEVYHMSLYYVFNTMLLTLLVFHIYWWILIFNMIMRQLKNRGQVGEDIRSGNLSFFRFLIFSTIWASFCLGINCNFDWNMQIRMMMISLMKGRKVTEFYV